MFSRFDFKVDRNDEQTAITVSNCNFQTAVVLLSKCLKKFGNWSSDTQVKLWGKDRMLNGDANFSITIPAPKSPRHTRDPFTQEYVSGYFCGIREFLDDKSSKELAEELVKDGW